MGKRIAILRGINVGGKRIILMADLKILFEKSGFTNIKTYIQSGNVIFNSEVETSNVELSNKIEKEISEKYGFDVPVIVRTVEELENSISSNPFYKEKEIDINKLHLTLLKDSPKKEYLANTNTYNYSPDKFEIKDKNVFILCEGKYHQSKLTNNFFESKLKASATTRNWKTILKLFELCR